MLRRVSRRCSAPSVAVCLQNLGGGAALHLLGELAGGGNHHAAAAINQPHNAPDVGGAAGDERAAGNVGEDVDPMDDANNAGNVAQGELLDPQ